jgi:hypothetical protein
VKKELSQAVLHKIVLYHPTTGLFTKTDGTNLKHYNMDGYVGIYLKKYGVYKAHRLAFLFIEGSWPEHLVDHIDGDRSNNAWINLRSATHQQNGQNRRAKSKNMTGLLGVSKHGKNFVASIYVEGCSVKIGVYATKEEAPC